MVQVSQQLIDDHAAVDKVLQQCLTALRDSDLELAYNKLDLFWARLAVHIRAEHLHLFPTVLSSLENAEEAQAVVAELRRDHDFFMHELAVAIEVMRELPKQPVVAEGLSKVTKIVLEVQQRLVKHNELEENQIYRWATTFLNSEQQANLATLITTELQKRPSRFTSSEFRG